MKIDQVVTVLLRIGRGIRERNCFMQTARSVKWHGVEREIVDVVVGILELVRIDDVSACVDG